MMTARPIRPLRAGFTLTELLVALLIIAGLAGIAFPLIRGGMRAADQAGCLSNLRQIGLGLEAYLQDHGQRMPVMESGRRSREEDVPVLETVLAPYLENDAVFRCPADPGVWEKSGSSYLWNSTQNGLRRNQLAFFGTERPERIPLIIDKEAWHPQSLEGTNFFYADLTSSNKVRFSVSP